MSSKGNFVIFTWGECLCLQTEKKKTCHQKNSIGPLRERIPCQGQHLSMSSSIRDGCDTQEQRCSKSRGLQCLAQDTKLHSLVTSIHSGHNTWKEGKRKGFEVTQGLKGKARGSGSGRKWGSRQTQCGSGMEACDWSLSVDSSAPTQEQFLTHTLHCPQNSKGGVRHQSTTLGPVSNLPWV